jgi:hypothetical protein
MVRAGDKVRLKNGAIVRVMKLTETTIEAFDGRDFSVQPLSDVTETVNNEPICPSSVQESVYVGPAKDTLHNPFQYCKLHDRHYYWGALCGECVSNTLPISSTHIKYPVSEKAPDKVDYTPTKETTAPTGSLRFNTGKPQTSEIDPDFLFGMGRVLEKARVKYPRGNWALGNNYSVPFDSLMRHLLAWQSGESLDSETGENHLYHAALNLMMLAYYEQNFPDMDDRIFKKAKK